MMPSLCGRSGEEDSRVDEETNRFLLWLWCVLLS